MSWTNPIGQSKPRRGRGEHGVSWDKVNHCYVGTISLGHDAAGKRVRRTLTGKTKAEVRAKLDALEGEIKADIRTPATYTVGQCMRDGLDSLTLDLGTIASYRGQAQKWIYPKIGAVKLKDFKATDAERFLSDLGKVLSKRSLVMIKSTLQAQCGPLGQGRDGAVTVAALIAAQRDGHQIPCVVACRALGCPAPGTTSGPVGGCRPRLNAANV